MFEQAILAGAGRTGKPWTVPVSFGGQILAVGLMVLVPLAFTERMPFQVMPPSAPLRYGGATPKVEKGNVVQVVKTEIVRRTGFYMPTRIPTRVAQIIEAPTQEIAQNFTPCTGVCIPGGIEATGPIGAVPAMQQIAPPQPPQPKAVEPPKAAVVKAPPIMRVSTGVQEAKLITRVVPVYPRIAAQTRIMGTVQLTAIIGTEGRIRELKVTGGHPMLVPAAIEAVRQWVYRPTLLNGEPVEVVTEIAVNFRLGN